MPPPHNNNSLKNPTAIRANQETDPECLQLENQSLSHQAAPLRDLSASIDSSLDRLEHALDRTTQQTTQHPFELTVVVPVFNERTTLPRVLERIDESLPASTQTIIVDDASTDGTTEWLAELTPRQNRSVITRKRNHGKGSAVRLGIRHSGGRVVAIQDADLEYDPADLLRVIAPIMQGRYRVVYGSRYLAPHSDPSWFHRFGNQLLTATSNCLTGQRLTDMETCHKAFDGELIRSIPLRECRFGFEPEITGKVASRRIVIGEVPTGYRYRTYAEGKKISWKDGFAAIASMWRYRTRGWFPRLLTSIPDSLGIPSQSSTRGETNR